MQCKRRFFAGGLTQNPIPILARKVAPCLAFSAKRAGSSCCHHWRSSPYKWLSSLTPNSIVKLCQHKITENFGLSHEQIWVVLCFGVPIGLPSPPPIFFFFFWEKEFYGSCDSVSHDFFAIAKSPMVNYCSRMQDTPAHKTSPYCDTKSGTLVKNLRKNCPGTRRIVLWNHF